MFSRKGSSVEPTEDEGEGVSRYARGMSQPLKPIEVASMIACALGEASIALELLVARPVFKATYDELGGALPVPTAFVVESPIAFALLVVPSLFLVPALAVPNGPRTPLMIAAGVVALALAACVMLAFYLPMWVVAGNVVD